MGIVRTPLTENQRSLVQLCIEIARDHFKEYGPSMLQPRLIEQFDRQTKEADELLLMLAEADAIIFATETA